MDSAQPRSRKRNVKADSSSSLTSDIEEVPTKISKLPMLSKPLDIYEGNFNDWSMNGGFRRATKIFGDAPV
jgi:hypothetical protein